MARLSTWSVLGINGVQVEGADPEIVPDIEQTVNAMLKGKYLGLFARSNILLYPRQAIAKALPAAWPQIESAAPHIEGGWSLGYGRQLVVSVKERVPAAVVCASLPDWQGERLSVETAESCYFADRDGLLFEPAPDLSSRIYERYYIPGAGLGPPAGRQSRQATTAPEFTALRNFYEGASAAGLQVRAILVRDGGEYELYADNPPGAAVGTAVIYFNDSRPLVDELANLVAFWQTKTAVARSGGPAAAFNSVDLRYGSNVFYRPAR